MITRHTAGRHPRLAGRWRWSMVAVAVTMLTLVAACGDDSSGSGSTSIAAAPTSTIAALPGIEPVSCDPASARPGETVTRDPGGHESGISVVADYHWAIITSRDSARATDAIAPGNAMARPQLIADALAGFPPGTTYCLRLRQTTPTTVLFTLSYKPPAGVAAEYRLRATVTGAPGAVRMTGEVEQ